MPKRFHLVGLGCPKNQVDSEHVWAALAGRGWLAVDDPAEAELIVINTCAFLQSAVEESLDTIVELGRHRREGVCRKLVVAGCLPARYQEGLVADLDEVDLFISPSEIGRLADLVDEGGTGRRLVGPAGASFLADADTPRANSLSAGAAYLKVAEGCSRRCAFCIIPKLRGPQQSRPLDDLVVECENLVHHGVSEIVLVAQDLAAWGRDLPGRPSLDQLVAALSEVPGLWWLRLMYLYPNEVSDTLLDLMAERDAVLPYLDIPLQHVDRQVLRRMRRSGDPESLLAFIAHVRERVPGIVLRTSLMTGFPGEDEAAFGRLVDFVRQVRFERLGVFAFSPEEGTEAAGMSGACPVEEAEARREKLMEVQQPIAEAYHRSLIGRSMEALVEGVDGVGQLTGRAWNQAPEVDGETFLEGEGILGEVVRVRITDADAYDLRADVIG